MPLPEPVARFRALVDDEPRIETVVIETTAWMHRPPLPAIPLAITMAHRLGADFVHDIRIGRRPLAFRFGLDAYLDGQGVMKVGSAVSRGIHYDQGALIALWGEVVGFPAAWEGRDDVRWEPLDRHRARLVVQGPEGELPITVQFDASSGMPAGVHAERYKADGPKVGWTGRSGEWRRLGGVLVPGRFSAQWDDEAQPWIRITTRSVRVNVPVEDQLALGRALLAGRRPEPRPAPEGSTRSEPAPDPARTGPDVPGAAPEPR